MFNKPVFPALCNGVIENLVFVQTEFGKYAAQVDSLDVELCEQQNQVKNLKEENFCLKHTLEDNQKNFDFCMQNAENTVKELRCQLDQTRTELEKFCSLTYEPAIADATAKVSRNQFKAWS